jgi:hypothetical protein
MNSMSEAWKRGRGTLLAILLLLVGILVWGVNDTRTGQTFSPGSRQDLLSVLAPLIILATGIERFWEAVFSWYESFALSVGRLLGAVSGVTTWAKTEVGNAEKTVNDAATALGAKTPADEGYAEALKVFQEAEVRLLDAQSRITEAVKAPEYVALKRAITLLGSLVLGLAICVGNRMTLLQMAGFQNVPVQLDTIVTGLLVGAGPGPLHSFITALQELRNALASVADLARGTALKKVHEALPQPSAPARTPSGSSLLVPARTVGVDPHAPALAALATTERADPEQSAIQDLRLTRQARRLFSHR